MQRPPTTLWTHTFADLAKLLLLSAGVLVVIIALGAAIKPISDGLLEAQDAVVYVSLALVPMLAYVLPFAAGFASTLVYHRIGTSNEAIASYAGGISHRRLLVPALAMGLTLGVGVGVLNESVIPRFLREMRHLITVDFARLLSTQIGRGKALRLDDWLVLAERAETIAPAPGTGVREQVVFSKFAAIKLSKDGMPEQEVAASQATMWLYPPGSPPEGWASDETSVDEDESVVLLEMRGVSASDATSVGGFRESSTAVFSVPNVFRDNPKYLTYRELRDLRRFPERMNEVDARRRELALALERESVERFLAQGLRGGEVVLADEEGRTVRLVARAGAIDWAAGRAELMGLTDSRAIEVWHHRDADRGSVALHSLAARGELRIGKASRGSSALGVGGPARGAGAGSGVVVWLELFNVRTREEDTQATFAGVPERTQLRVTGLRVVDEGSARLWSKSSSELMALARGGTSPASQQQGAALQRTIDGVLREALSKQHERWAMAASCFVVTLTGAITALLLGQRMPLTTYAWTFVPGLVSWVTISGGQQLTEQQGASGLWLMWAGVLALGAYAGVMFWRLSRH